MFKRDYREPILARLPKYSIGAEIGVYKGEFSSLTLKRLKPREFHLIDPWKCREETIYRAGWYGADKTTQAEMDAIMDAIYESVRSRFARNGTRIHRMTSAEAVKTFPNHYFDWVYVDGDHQYEAVKKDLELYLPKLKPSGFLCGDDYGNPGWWQDGVTRAVNEFISQHPCKTVLIENHQFLMQMFNHSAVG
jgi:hypothetical protein